MYDSIKRDRTRLSEMSATSSNRYVNSDDGVIVNEREETWTDYADRLLDKYGIINIGTMLMIQSEEEVEAMMKFIAQNSENLNKEIIVRKAMEINRED